MDVRDKVAIITGASAGIGLATARIFAQAGARLALVARSIDTLRYVAEELSEDQAEAIAVPADMRNKAEVERMVAQVYEKFGRIDILINNAGQGVYGAIAEVSPDYLHQVMELNVFGPLYAMQAVVPMMRQRGGGLIINISSMLSKTIVPGLGAYASTKYALNCLSQTAQIELAPDNIRVLLVYPEMSVSAFTRDGSFDAKAFEAIEGTQLPSGDSPEKVAHRILEAAQSELASKI